MKKVFILFGLYILLLIASTASAIDKVQRIVIVSSYHAEYQWSQGTNKGLMNGLLERGYLDNKNQINEFTEHHSIQTSTAIIKKYWMDTKRKNTKDEIAHTLHEITKKIDQFNPDIILLGDDNAANYVGNYYLDTDIPIVFWGVNGTPLKYGLLDSIAMPGHNVTGVYQQNYHKENLKLLLKLLPTIKSVAILSDDSATGLSHTKLFQREVKELNSTIHIEEVVITNNFEHWKKKAASLNNKVDAFLISSNHTLKSRDNETISSETLLRWYLNNINKPEIVAQVGFVKDGMLATVFDSPFKQGYETAKIAHNILSKNRQVNQYPPYSPNHGGYIVNEWRAQHLGLLNKINDNKNMFYEIINKHILLD